MRSCSIEGTTSSSSRQRLSLQSLQVRIKRAAELSKRHCCCSRECLHGSTFITVPHVLKHGHASPLHAAAGEGIAITSPQQTSSQGPAKQITWTQPQQSNSKSTKQQHASKQKTGFGAAPQRESSHRKSPQKAKLSRRLPSAGLQGASEIAAPASKDAGIALCLSQLEAAYKRHDPGACHQAVQQLKHLAERMSADQLLADASPTCLHAWWRKLNQDARAGQSRAGQSSNSGSQSSTAPLYINGDQHLGRGNTPSSSDAQSLAVGEEQLYAKLLHTAQQMQSAQRTDMFLHYYHPKLVQLWLATGHQDWAQHYVATLPPVLPNTTYNYFVASCEKYNSVKTLNVVLEAQQASAIPLTRYATRTAIAVYDRKRDLSAVLRLFEKAVDSRQADTDIYTDTMASCLASHKYEVAFDIYDRLKRSGLELTLHSFHMALKGSSYLKAAGVQELYAQMRDTPDLNLKDRTFAYVFRAVASCGGGFPAYWIIQVLADMNNYSVKMNSYIFTAFLQAMTLVTLAPEQVEAVFGAMANYRACEPATAFVYTALLTFCAKQAPDRALDVWHAMQEDGVPVSSHLLSSLFAACAAAGSQDMLEAADRSHMDMEGLWNKICSRGKSPTEERDMLQAHNALLHVYASHGLVGKAKQLFSSMQERGPAVDNISAGTLIAAYAKVADHEAALEVFRELKAAGLQPTAQCYTSLLAACGRAGDLAAARRLFKSMHVQPSVEAYTALIDACLKKGTPAALDEAFQVFEELKTVRNLKPTATTYGCLLKVCELRNDVETAFKLYEEAFEVGVLATDECHNMLIDVCSDAGRVDEAIELVKALASKHGSMKQATLNSLIRSLSDVGQVARALRLLSIMLNMALKPYRSTINALIAACARESHSLEAGRLYWGLREQGGEASKAAGSELIISLCKAGDRMEALKVYRDMTSPNPTHHLHALPLPGKKGDSKSATKQQRAEQRQEAAKAAAVGTVTRATKAAATAVELAGDSASQTEQMGFDRHNSQAGTRNQTANAAALNGQSFQAGAHLSDQTAEHLAQASLDGGLNPPSASDLSAARKGTRTHKKAGAHEASPTMPPRGRASQPWTDPVTVSNQATAAKPTNGPVSGLQTTAATPDCSSSGDSSSDGPASMSSEDSLLLKPDGQQPLKPADATYASSASEHLSYVSHRHDSAELLRPSESPPSSDPYTSGSPKQQQDRSPSGDSRSALGSGVDKGGGPNGAQAEVILRKRPVAPASSSDSSHGHARLVGSLKLSPKAICFPSIGATAALVHAFAIADDIPECFRLYQQLQRDQKGLPGLTQSNRRMWEEAIEAACRAGRTEWALQIFDDWKASSMSLMFLQPRHPSRPVKFPQLSNATLAFLESCSRGSSQHEWRVYDVCAVMRQQKERKREAALDRPAKKSHHVADAA